MTWKCDVEVARERGRKARRCATTPAGPGIVEVSVDEGDSGRGTGRCRSGCAVSSRPSKRAGRGRRTTSRAEAVELRGQGCTVPRIAERLGVSRSSAFLWTRDLPLDAGEEEAASRRRRQAKRVADARWTPLNRARPAACGDQRGRAQLGRRAFPAGGAAARCGRGSQSGAESPSSTAIPGLILLFLRVVEALGEDRQQLKYGSALVSRPTWWPPATGGRRWPGCRSSDSVPRR